MASIFVHSATSDFAETQRLPESLYLGRVLSPRRRPRLFSCGCGCGTDHLVRVKRAAWMRLVPRFRLYQCRTCGTRVFRPRLKHRLGYGAVYLPPKRLPATAHRVHAWLGLISALESGDRAAASQRGRMRWG